MAKTAGLDVADAPAVHCVMTAVKQALDLIFNRRHSHQGTLWGEGSSA